MSKPKRQHRLGKKAKARAARAAKHLDGRMAHAAFSYAANRSVKGRFGKMGAASAVRQIDPAEYVD